MHSQPALRQAYLGNGKKPSVNGGKLATKIFTDNCYFDFFLTLNKPKHPYHEEITLICRLPYWLTFYGLQRFTLSPR